MTNNQNFEHTEKKKRDYLLPSSILVAALLISGALIYNSGKPSDEKNLANLSANAVPENPLEAIQPITAEDHIRGSLSAPIQIVEFSDTECPYCKDFYGTMKKITETYKEDVAWIYRHAPIDSLHMQARNEAEATECAAELGGNDAFWAFLDRLHDIAPSDSELAPSELPKVASYIGLDKTDFELCLSSGRHANAVEADLNDAVKSGLEGTPYSVIFIKGKALYVLPGRLPFEEETPGNPYMKLIVDELLSEI